MEGDSAAPIYVMERIGSVVLNFGNEDEIVSQGIVSYTKGEKLI
jgi:hypothetical protein